MTQRQAYDGSYPDEVARKWKQERDESRAQCSEFQFKLKDAIEALTPLKKIADAYDANELDAEARRFYGLNHQHENKTHPQFIQLYQGRGGKELLTLEDCFRAREFLRKMDL